MIGWIAAGVFAYAATLVGVLGLCRAAKEGDRQLHAHHPPLDADLAEWDDLERRLTEPDRYCPACGTWLAGDQLFDRPERQAAWLEDA